MELALVLPAAAHGARGFGASLAAVMALANALRNRSALLGRSQARALSLRGPSRGLATFAVFVGSFRFVQRLIALKKRREEGEEGSRMRGVLPASVVAGVLSAVCLPPKSRPAIVSLLSTNALSLAFRDFIKRNPRLALLQPLELAAFMAACGWIYYSGFFHPDSYERSHMNLLLKYTLLSREATNRLQEQYALGENPNPCVIRHPGKSCSEFYLHSDFFSQVVKLGVRIYLPVHLMSWLLSMRKSKQRAKPKLELATTFVSRLARSVAYFFGFVGVGWVFSCVAGPLGDRSVAMRKLQFFLCGSLPAAALLFELPSRRRPIGVILTSYVLVSVMSVATKDIKLLHDAKFANVRTLLEGSTMAASIAYTVSGSLEHSQLLRWILLGPSPQEPTKKTEQEGQLERVSS